MPRPCMHCGSDVPLGQSVCPECYRMRSGSEEAQPSGERAGKNVMVFLCDRVYSEWFQDQVVNRMAELTRWIFRVDTPEALREVARDSVGSWGLVVVDVDVAQQSHEPLRCFVEENPGIVVAVLYDIGACIPSKGPIENVFAFRRPSDVDAWLLLTRQLLTRARRS